MKRLLTLLMFVFCGVSNAQIVYELGFTSSGVTMTDTATLYSSYDMQFSVVNNGSAVISDPIDIFAAVNDTVSGVSLTPRWLGGVSNITLNPLDTFHFSLGVIYDNVTPQNAYGPGDNIVVIWPKADAPVSQSTQYFYNNLYVLNTTTTNHDAPHLESNVVKLINDQVFIEISNFKEAQIYSIDGKLIHVSETQSIITENFAPGVFIVSVISKDNKAYSTTIVVE